MYKLIIVFLFLIGSVSCRSGSKDDKHPDDPNVTGIRPGETVSPGCLKAHASWSEAITSDDNLASLAKVFVNPESDEAKDTVKKAKAGQLSCKPPS